MRRTLARRARFLFSSQRFANFIAATSPDDLAELGALACERDLWLHVDACVGGYFAPFARHNGVELPEFDFAVPGVRTISADLHKYGYAAKGASPLFHRTEEQREHQVFRFDDWPAGGMRTPTAAGTRPGGAIAAAWAVPITVRTSPTPCIVSPWYLSRSGFGSKVSTWLTPP